MTCSRNYAMSGGLNFVQSHFTTKKVPAVALGIIDKSLSLLDVFKIPMVAFN
jgi:hypothetical protein